MRTRGHVSLPKQKSRYNIPDDTGEHEALDSCERGRLGGIKEGLRTVQVKFRFRALWPRANGR